MNTLEQIEWGDNPVQITVCEACGFVGCASGGYVHVSRLDKFVLLTSAQVDPDDDLASSQYGPHFALQKFGAIAIPEATWTSWRALVPDVPDSSTFPTVSGRSLAEAWALGPGRPKRLEKLLAMLRHRVLACDTLTRESAIQHVHRTPL